MQDFYRCAPGHEAKANWLANRVCQKLVTDMHHEARPQAVRTYYAKIIKVKISKKEARTKFLTKEQYMQVNGEYYLCFFLIFISLELVLLCVIYLMTCRCLRGGVQANLTVGKL